MLVRHSAHLTSPPDSVAGDIDLKAFLRALEDRYEIKIISVRAAGVAKEIEDILPEVPCARVRPREYYINRDVVITTKLETKIRVIAALGREGGEDILQLRQLYTRK